MVNYSKIQFFGSETEIYQTTGKSIAALIWQSGGWGYLLFLVSVKTKWLMSVIQTYLLQLRQ
jgi:hypothetical protein